MKQGRTPDRVHVVHRPAQDDYRAESRGGALPTAPQNNRAIEIIRTLAQISDKLKRSEAERYELLAELREYRKTLNDLEDKAEKSEKAYLALENKLKSRDAIEAELSQRQVRFERALKEAESKLVQASAGQNLIATRLKDTEDKQAMLVQRVDESVVQQARLDRQMEKIGQDKARMLRKVERMEEILTETQDTLKARALVLLTDQSAAANGAFPQIAAYGDNMDRADNSAPWWRKSVRMQSVGMASMVVAALLLGWTINQVQQPEIPQIAVLENGGVARINLDQKQWEPIAQTQRVPASEKAGEPTLTPVQAKPENAEAAQIPSQQTPAALDVMNASDEELLAALEENPDALAAKLNDIAPEATRALESTTDVPASAPVGASYNPLAALGAKAFAQDPQLANAIAKEKGTQALAQRVGRDQSLPAAIGNLQNQSFAGVPEAQHDLAAIYTAGRAGVAQDFEKAAIWFREAADSGIANAAYNLGVLYHQGLGVEKDMERALYWYREAAKEGHPEAQYNLGIAHIEGIGTEYNAPLAAAFFESAANQGIVEAAYNLGLIYENGLTGAADKAENALLWYKIAADGGSNDAKAALQQLSSSMQIGMEDVEKMVSRMQEIYLSAHGRKAGPDGKAADGARTSSAASQSDRAMVAQVQESLRQLGYYNGVADGITGPQTASAIKTYQTANGLPATGAASRDLLAHLLSRSN